MSDKQVPKEITQVLDVASIAGGEEIVFSLQYKDKSAEWFSFNHSRAGKIIQGLMFAASVAKQNRPTKTPAGNDLPELSSVIDISSFTVLSLPGEDFVALRLSLSPSVHLDYRIPIQQVPAMKDKLDQAVAFAQSGKPSLSS